MQTRSVSKVMGELEREILALAGSQGKTVESLSTTDDFIAAGVFDSMSLLQFVLAAERICGIKIPGEDVVPDNFASLASIAAYLRESHGFGE
jgi:acyl carrier protein